MNKITKHILRIWISITSVIIFTVGWIALAHAEKPAPLNIQTIEVFTAPNSVELPPIQSLDQLTQNSRHTTFSQPSITFNSMPRLRTRGS